MTSAHAEQLKLNPANDDAWNALGEVMWKKKDMQSARKCFESACESVVSLILLIESEDQRRTPQLVDRREADWRTE